MGVQGLFTFIEGNSQIYQDIHFRNSKLVVDGCNLIYLLYFDAGLDLRHGGEYDAFEDLLRKFVKALRDSGIELYVVLDGGTDSSERKFETLRKRAEDRIQKAHNAAMGQEERILPLLAKAVFKQTLAKLNVSLAQCFGEADQEIASLASELRCPVLSNDSDFYVFDLPAGFLPISHFQWKAVSHRGNQTFIPCKRYTTSSFCTFFKIERRLLPVFSAVAGNDYVKLREMGLMVRWEEYAPADRGKMSRLEGLLRWLRDFQQPEDVLRMLPDLLGQLSGQKLAEVRDGLSLGMEGYQLPPSSLHSFFSDGTAPPLLPEACGVVPDWARLPLTQARLTSDILDVLLLNSMPLSTAVDHRDLLSANLTSRPIRQVIYGLLLGVRKRVRVQEIDREGLRLVSILVRPVLRGGAQQLKLDSLHEAEPSVRLRVCLETLGVNETTLTGLPAHLRLPVAVTRYWLQKASPRPDPKLVQALLLGMVDGEIRRQREATRGLTQYTGKIDLGVAHSCNQWQTSLKDAIHLNQLLGFPLPEPQIAWLFRGTLVHQLVRRLRRGTKPQLLLRRGASSEPLYRALLAAVLQDQPQDATSIPAGRRGTAPQPLDDLAVRLGQLQLPEEEEEEEEERAGGRSVSTVGEDLDWVSVSVRTRYKTKDRGHRPKIPELSRKQERTGW
ncbi:single-strand DNA endonuclease ASTE1-like [Polymixia lowei]